MHRRWVHRPPGHFGGDIAARGKGGGRRNDLWKETYSIGAAVPTHARAGDSVKAGGGFLLSMWISRRWHLGRHAFEKTIFPWVQMNTVSEIFLNYGKTPPPDGGIDKKNAPYMEGKQNFYRKKRPFSSLPKKRSQGKRGFFSLSLVCLQRVEGAKDTGGEWI